MPTSASSPPPEAPAAAPAPQADAPPGHAPRRLPPLIALSYLEAAARTGSFATAARQLHVSAAAVSHQIKALEDYLGVELFIRQARRVIPTPAAAAALPRLQAGFAALAEAAELLRTHGETRWRITICAEPLFATKGLVPRLHRFYARCPQAELRLQASLSSVDGAQAGGTSAASFQRNGIDLSIRLGHGRHPGLLATPLQALSLQPVCTPALAAQLQSPADILAQPLLTDGTHRRCAEQLGWRDWLAVAGLTPPAVLREQHFGNALLALEAALAGQGILLACPALLQPEMEAGKLQIPFPQALRPALAYHLVCPPAALQRPIVRAFHDWLLAEFQVAEAPA